MERVGLQADGARVTATPSLFRPLPNDEGATPIFWNLVVYWTEVEVGGFMLGTPSQVNFGASDFGTNRYRQVNREMLQMGTALASQTDLGALSACTASFLRGQHQVPASILFMLIGSSSQHRSGRKLFLSAQPPRDDWNFIRHNLIGNRGISPLTPPSWKCGSTSSNRKPYRQQR